MINSISLEKSEEIIPTSNPNKENGFSTNNQQKRRRTSIAPFASAMAHKLFEKLTNSIPSSDSDHDSSLQRSVVPLTTDNQDISTQSNRRKQSSVSPEIPSSLEQTVVNSPSAIAPIESNLSSALRRKSSFSQVTQSVASKFSANLLNLRFVQDISHTSESEKDSPRRRKSSISLLTQSIATSFATNILSLKSIVPIEVNNQSQITSRKSFIANILSSQKSITSDESPSAASSTSLRSRFSMIVPTRGIAGGIFRQAIVERDDEDESDEESGIGSLPVQGRQLSSPRQRSPSMALISAVASQFLSPLGIATGRKQGETEAEAEAARHMPPSSSSSSLTAVTSSLRSRFSTIVQARVAAIRGLARAVIQEEDDDSSEDEGSQPESNSDGESDNKPSPSIASKSNRSPSPPIPSERQNERRKNALFPSLGSPAGLGGAFGALFSSSSVARREKPAKRKLTAEEIAENKRQIARQLQLEKSINAAKQHRQLLERRISELKKSQTVLLNDSPSFEVYAGKLHQRAIHAEDVADIFRPRPPSSARPTSRARPNTAATSLRPATAITTIERDLDRIDNEEQNAEVLEEGKGKRLIRLHAIRSRREKIIEGAKFDPTSRDYS